MKSVLFFIVVTITQAFADARVDALLEDYNRPDVPGASVLVMQYGHINHIGAYGSARLKGEIQAEPKTNYRLASLSKQFTATAALLLVKQGKLSLDTRLTEIFPDFPQYGREIKLKHLLSHQSGLRDYEDLIPGSQTQQVLDKDVLQIMMRQSSGYFQPGSQYKYSNSGYCVLGEIVTKISGESYAEFARKNIFQPLGMNRTVLYEKGISEVSDRAYGHSPSGGGFSETDQSITSATLGDGGVYTSVMDWIQWERGLEKADILGEELQKLVFTPAVLNNGSKTSYGFGWMLDTYRGYTRHHHTGSTIGFRTAVQRLPQKEDLTVVVLVNRANSSPWSIAERILDLYL